MTINRLGQGAPIPVNSQQNNQIDRIQQGIKNGNLTEGEAAKLIQQQANIAQVLTEAMADGNLSLGERAKLNQLQQQANKDIFQATHNGAKGNPYGSPDIKDAQVNQLERIQQGMNSGSLTNAEAAGLLREQAGIAGNMAQAQANGFMDGVERMAIKLQQMGASDNIAFQANDFQQQARPGMPGSPGLGDFHALPFQPSLPGQGGLSPFNPMQPSTGMGMPPHGGMAPPVSLNPGLLQPQPSNVPAGLTSSQGRQLDRIQQGLSNGKLSEGEAARLMDQQARISDRIARAMADGVMTRSERRDIERMQRQANRDLSRAENNRTRGNPGANPAGTFTQAQQIRDIRNGLANGTMTPQDAAGLLREQAGIARDMGRARADGRVDPHEAMATMLRQMGAGQNIQNRTFNPAQAAQGLQGGQNNLLDMLQQGIASGALSQNEAANLLNQHAGFSDALKNAMADGRLTREEANSLQQQQSQLFQGTMRAMNNFEFGNPFMDPMSTMAQLDQIGRIQQGLGSGLLTPGEGGNLLREQAGIARGLGAAQADGQVDPFEYMANLLKMLGADNNINNQMFNGQFA